MLLQVYMFVMTIYEADVAGSMGNLLELLCLILK